MTMTHPTPDDAPVLRLSRSFAAPRDRVFRAFTAPAQLARWWGPKGFTVPACTLDVRAGGAWRTVMRSPEGKDHIVSGVYREITPPSVWSSPGPGRRTARAGTRPWSPSSWPKRRAAPAWSSRRKASKASVRATCTVRAGPAASTAWRRRSPRARSPERAAGRAAPTLTRSGDLRHPEGRDDFGFVQGVREHCPVQHRHGRLMAEREHPCAARRRFRRRSRCIFDRPRG